MKIFYYFLGPLLAILAIVVTLSGDSRLKTSTEDITTSMKDITTSTEDITTSMKEIGASMQKINSSVEKQISSLIRVNERLDLTEVTTALWSNDRAESYLTMLTTNHAYGCAGRYVDYSDPPDRKLKVTEDGNKLIAELDDELKSRLFNRQKQHQDWSPAQIIREENLSTLQKLISSYNYIQNPSVHVDIQTVVGIMNACIIGG